VIAAKRDGGRIDAADLERFVAGVSAGQIGDGQAAAFLMAALLQGMDADETLAMTRAMIASGDTIGFPDLGAPSVDKHSTGGVADGVTLVFAPMAAALGLAVAKLSGRGLGHTGGTLDKLESIPGLRTDLDPGRIAAQVAAVGCAVAAQSARVVPADGALYALRDATATVPSIPLIAASVMSKKLAVRTDLILLDVKCGSGAFMRTPEDARALAAACSSLAAGAGRRCGVAVTDMSQPLGDAIGNALDVIEAVEVLAGRSGGRLRELAVWFAARAVALTTGERLEAAAARAEATLDDGTALERFRAMVMAQGGDAAVADDPEGVLPVAPVRIPVEAPRDGVLASVDAAALGQASSALGAGRIHKGDAIDPAVGIVVPVKIGDRVTVGEPVATIHARTDDDARAAATAVLAAMSIGSEPVEPPGLVLDWTDPAVP
jgi:pyrimidine-nucleoside phosphorylase